MKIDWMRLFTPSAWVQLGEVDWEYDDFLNRSLDEHGLIILSECAARTGNFVIWIGNYPYSHGHPYDEREGYYTLPSIKTRKRIVRMVRDSVKSKWRSQCK